MVVSYKRRRYIVKFRAGPTRHEKSENYALLGLLIISLSLSATIAVYSTEGTAIH